MPSDRIELSREDVEACGYTMKLVALIFALLNPAATVRAVQAETGVSKRCAHDGWSMARDRNGTETGHAERPPEPLSEDLRDRNGTETGQSAGQQHARPRAHAPARAVFDFGSGTTTKATTNNKRASGASFSPPDWIPEQDWNDLIEHRRKKHAANTPRGLKAIAAQLDKARGLGFTIQECLDEMMLRDWRGFKAEWMPSKPTKLDHHFTDSPSPKREPGVPNWPEWHEPEG